MSLQPLREEIDGIDEQLVELFKNRMECSRKVAEYKQEHGMAVFNKEREEQLLDKVTKSAGIYGDFSRNKSSWNKSWEFKKRGFRRNRF